MEAKEGPPAAWAQASGGAVGWPPVRLGAKVPLGFDPGPAGSAANRGWENGHGRVPGGGGAHGGLRRAFPGGLPGARPRERGGRGGGQSEKVLRDQGGEFDPAAVEAIADELGDVLWYVAVLAADLGLSLDRIASQNVEKLRSRQARGRLGGEGDLR
jgi:MazG nucleotide pyrophosphohydrolase domain